MTSHAEPADAVLEEAPNSGTAGLLAALALALAAEAGVVACAIGLPGPFGLAVAFGGHAGVVAAVALWVRSRARRGLDLRLAGLLLVTTPVLGPIGPACTLLTTLLHALFRRYATGFQDWYLSLFPESQSEPAQELYELIVSGRETSHLAAAESFTDVMSVGSPQQKQAVIALVARHFRPAFTPALKAGLADSDPSVRVQAATATARVEHEFNERWLELDGAARANPQDARAGLALARHLDDYAFCGLLDTNREQEIRDKAQDGYRRGLELAPDDDDARHDFGRLLLRCGLVEEAARTLDPLVERTDDRRVLFWYAECLFRLRRYGDLRAMAERRADLMPDGGDSTDTLASVIALWSAPAEDRKEPVFA
ncbi:tetratricopeptide repeat protein [Azospirillum canadense]|uniref:tetratricopeptide repeat protein n=1 Tax=Azospirillum canadense TaxID=403962 RepID=UPI00222745E7|nr:tetratricopeptide repeat protein [Azospirillum canadense]MCW2243386.1 tetratricopeptide (TPR) repeat protein [Azospirillum canadense]